MKIALLQDEIFVPSYAGGIKANRCLLEELACRGHQCLALTRALTRSPDGPNDLSQFNEEMASRGLNVHEASHDVWRYEYRKIEVEAINCPGTDARRQYISGRLQSFEPDWVLVGDDKRRYMLASANEAAPGRAIPLLQTIMQLPFGPLSIDENRQQTQLMSAAPIILVISEYMQRYIRAHGQMESRVVSLPVYGAPPFPNLASFNSGFVTIINPCELKGVEIFLDLARAFPEVSFAAVPTWGADDTVLQQLRDQPNVRLIPASDEVEDILSQTRILLVPSIWPETFGYVVPEAMLRGIPVLASNLGGLPEAKLGVEYLLPVAPAQRRGDSYVCPPQEIQPWSQALSELLGDAEIYQQCSRKSREAALHFVSQIDSLAFEQLLSGLETSFK